MKQYQTIKTTFYTVNIVWMRLKKVSTTLTIHSVHQWCGVRLLGSNPAFTVNQLHKLNLP